MYSSYMINSLCEDLEKKLELYTNTYNDKSLKYYFEKERYLEISKIILTENNEDIQPMIDKLPSYYRNGINFINNKFSMDTSEVSLICSQVYKQLHDLDKDSAFINYLDIVQDKLNGDIHWFFDLDFNSEHIKDHFLNNATEYIIQHQNKTWKEEFRKVDYARNSWLKYLREEDIPEKFSSKEELFLWLKYNKQEEVFHFLGLPLLNSLLSTIIHNETYNIHSNALNKNRIFRLLEECQNDYIITGQILVEKSINLNIFFLYYFEYALFGFLNLYELESAPHNLQSNDINYTEEWNKMLSHQMINIVFLHFSNLQNKEKFGSFIFYILNYMTKDYVNYFSNQYISNKKEYLFQKLLKELSKIEIRKNQYEKTFILDFILDELIKKQINQLSVKQINLSDYYLVSFYLTEMNKIEKLTGKNYSEDIKNIINSILDNLNQCFTNNLQDDRLYIKFEFLEKIDFPFMYEYSDNKDTWITLIDIHKVKNRWLEYDKEKAAKNGISSSDPHEPENIIKLYFYILVQIFEKNKDSKIAELLNKIAIKFGLTIDFGIFHEYSWRGHQFTEELFLKYIKMLNNFNDELFNTFQTEVFNHRRMRDILALLNYTEIEERKNKLLEKITNYVNNKELEFSSYYDIRESILYAQYNDLDDLSSKLIDIYETEIEKNNYKNNKKEFLEIKYKKELLDIFNNKDLPIDEKLNKLNQYQNPFDDRNYGKESKQIICDNYKDFIRAILFFETEPIKTYKILLQLIEKELNSIYLINMLNAYLKAYEDDKYKIEKFNYILNKYEEYDKKFNRKSKSLYEYQVLFYGYKEIDNLDKLEYLHKEIPDLYKNNIKEYLPTQLKLFDKVVNIKKKLIVCVEGEFDIKFLKNINQSIKEYKNIINLQDSNISIMSLKGSNLQAWVKDNHLEGSNIIELHIYDSDIGSTEQNENKYLKECEEVRNRKDSSYCFLTKKREMENYIHKSLIEHEFKIDMSNIKDWDKEDIPTYILSKTNGKKKEKAIKSILNGKLSEQITKDLLQDIDAFDELKMWFEKMKELSNV